MGGGGCDGLNITDGCVKVVKDRKRADVCKRGGRCGGRGAGARIGRRDSGCALESRITGNAVCEGESFGLGAKRAVRMRRCPLLCLNSLDDKVKTTNCSTCCTQEISNKSCSINRD